MHKDVKWCASCGEGTAKPDRADCKKCGAKVCDLQEGGAGKEERAEGQGQGQAGRARGLSANQSAKLLEA